MVRGWEKYLSGAEYKKCGFVTYDTKPHFKMTYSVEGIIIP